MKMFQTGAIPWHIIGVLAVIGGLVVAMQLYKANYEKWKERATQTEIRHQIFVKQTDEIQKGYEEAYELAAKRAAKSETKWKSHYETKTESIVNKYAADKRMREHDRVLRNKGQAEEELAGLARVRCGIEKGGWTGNFEQYRKKLSAAEAALHKQIQREEEAHRDRVRGELAKPLDLCQAELGALKGNLSEVILIK